MPDHVMTPLMRDLAELCEEQHALARAAMQTHHAHATEAGNLLREAMALLPPLTWPEWVTRYTLLTLPEAIAYVEFAKNAALLVDIDARAAALTTEQFVEYRQALEAGMVGEAGGSGQAESAEEAVLLAQVELCRAVLSRTDSSPCELAAVGRVLSHINDQIAGRLAVPDGDSRLFVAAGDEGIPF